MSVAGGYPEAYEKGHEIQGLEHATDSLLFHAGTTLKEGKVCTNGGRVLAVTSFGADYKAALATSYNTLEGISFKDIYYRKDLGFDLN
jgi:phosphoribosylamine--glycine ligase